MKPIIGITIGDPAGIGPEIITKALAGIDNSAKYIPVIIGDARVIIETANQLNIDKKINVCKNIEGIDLVEDSLKIFDFASMESCSYKMGTVDKDCGDHAYQAIVRAVELCQEGKIKAMVTAPICKESIQMAGHIFDGHTGLIAYLTNTEYYRMMFSSERLKIIFVTTHVPLKEACQTLDCRRIFDTIKLGYKHLIDLGIDEPRIAVCGLNPHAGESGIFGSEEEDIIMPAIRRAQDMGYKVEGPLPSDTVFLKAYHNIYDLVVAQYHDQGFIPGKLVAFDSGVNVTVGLPIVRTSVDHGTAFDIAGQGKAKYENLYCAIEYALKMI